MRVSIHQPHFLPWIGYFNKALWSDVFVWLNNVQFRKNYFQNRTLIKNSKEEPFWLTLPVHASLESEIREVTLADPKWQPRIIQTIEQFYRQAPFFESCWARLKLALEQPTDSLDEANYRSFLALLDILGGSSLKVVRASDLEVNTEEPTERLLQLCQKVGATTYISGKGGHKYLRDEAFQKAGISIVFQHWNAEEAVYPQLGSKFVPALSLIDCLFNTGPEHTLRLVKGVWKP